MSAHRLLLTRTREDCEHWRPVLEQAGFSVRNYPCIETQALVDAKSAQRLQRALAGADWLVVTSRRGVAAIAAAHPLPLPPGIRIACVGPATAATAKDAFGRADLQGERTTAAALGAAMVSAIDPATAPRILLALAENAGHELAAQLEAAGFTVERINVYRTIAAAETATKSALSDLACDTIVFASPTAVSGFMNTTVYDAPSAIVSIGPSTSAAVRKHGLEVWREAAHSSLEGILESIQCPA